MEEGEDERVKVSDYGKVLIPNREKMAKQIRGLDKDQRRVLNIAGKYAMDVNKARARGRAMPEPPHLMVHGSAGTGNSVILLDLKISLELLWDITLLDP